MGCFLFVHFGPYLVKMIQTYFSSTSGVPLIQVVDAFLAQAQEVEGKDQIGLDIMVFSFTSDLIFERLKTIAIAHRNIQVRILADWGNISKNNSRKLLDLIPFCHSNFSIRFKIDQPYVWDNKAGKLRWRYQASLGLLHHKTIQLTVNNTPLRLLTGSFNWTKTAGQNYENIVIFNAHTAANTLLIAFNHEFNCMWSNKQLSASYARANLIRAKIKQAYELKPAATALQVTRQIFGSYLKEDARTKPSTSNLLTDKLLVAFSANHPFRAWRNSGFCVNNAWRYFNMFKPQGKSVRVPLDLHTVALSVIYAATPKEELCLCMYAISPRVPEYTALLEVARKGVKLRCILDRTTNKGIIKKLSEVIMAEALPIQIKSGSRAMHQKYLVNAAGGMLVTGTANMSTDSSKRHTEHRILVQDHAQTITAFQEDFNTIWNRIS